MPTDLSSEIPQHRNRIVKFVDEDEAYLAFLAEPSHCSGFVLNTYRKPNAGYLALHKATCHTVQGTPASGSKWTSGLYCKIWAATTSEMTEWIRENLGGTPTPCGTCKPSLD